MAVFAIWLTCFWGNVALAGVNRFVSLARPARFVTGTRLEKKD